MAMMASMSCVYLLREKKFVFSGKSTRREMIRIGTFARRQAIPPTDNGVGVVEMGQDAAAPASSAGPGGRPRRSSSSLFIAEGQDGEPLGRGLLVERASGLDDEVDGISLGLELPGEEEGLPLAAAPLPAGVNLEEAQCALLSSRSRAASRSGAKMA